MDDTEFDERMQDVQDWVEEERRRETKKGFILLVIGATVGVMSIIYTTSVVVLFIAGCVSLAGIIKIIHPMQHIGRDR